MVFVQKSAVDVGRTWIVVVLYCLEKDWSHMFLAWFCTKRFAVPFDFIFRKKVVCWLSMWQWHFHLEWGSEDTRTEMKYGFYCWLIAYNIYKIRSSYSTNLVVWNAGIEMFEKLSKILCGWIRFTFESTKRDGIKFKFLKF